MSSFDLSRIVEALGSPKVKLRNDALQLLDGFHVSKLRLSLVQLASLVAALIKAIEAERGAFAKQNGGLRPGIGQTTVRAATASAFLRDLVQELLQKPASLKARPRLKTCLSLINSILTLYYEPASTLAFTPCCGSFATTLGALFETSFVFTHLPGETWMKAYNFLLQAITHELETDNSHGIDENLVSSLYSALYNLAGGSLASEISLLVRENTYFPLLRLLKRTLARFNKRETPVLVTAFKIINKLLVMLSTEDATFLHHLIQAALSVSLQFAATSVDSLLEQMLFLLNNDATHRYLSLAQLPRLGTVPMDDMTDDMTPEDSRLEVDSGVTLYNVEKLVYSLLQRLASVAHTLHTEDVGLHDLGKILDWYHLPQIYLVPRKNCLLWLLVSGISRLISTYYRVCGYPNWSKPSIANPQSTENFTKSFSTRSFSTRSFSTSSFKRQKLHARHMSLEAYKSPMQFYNALITCDDPKMQRCGLQLLTFYLELEGCIRSREEINTSFGSETENSFNFDESTVLDVAVDVRGPHSDSVLVFSNSVKLVTDRRLSFWALLFCRAFLFHCSSDTDFVNAYFQRRTHQLAKLLLDLIKESLVCSLACSVFSLLIALQSFATLRSFAESTVMNQLENVAELSDILGPYSLNVYATDFWHALARVLFVLGSKRRLRLAADIAKWANDKWDPKQDEFSPDQMIQVSYTILLILLLLSGGKNSHFPFKAISISTNRHFSVMKRGETLQNFIALEKDHNLSRTRSRHASVQFEHAGPAIDSIVNSVSNEQQFRSTEENEKREMPWAMMLVKLAGLIKHALPEHALKFEDTARNIILSFTPKIRLKDHALEVASILLLFSPATDILQDVAFPFEILDYHFNFSRSKHTLTVDLPTDLEAEFSADESQNSSRQYEARAENYEDQYTYFKVVSKYEARSPDKCIQYLNTLDGQCVLKCLSFFLDSGLLETCKSNLVVTDGIIRVIGEKLLSVQDLDRLDITTSISCRMLQCFFPVMYTLFSEDVRKDCFDLISYYLQCMEKQVFLSESSNTQVWNMLLDFTNYNDGRSIPNLEIMAGFLECMPQLSNKSKFIVSEVLHGYISNLDASAQTLYLDKFIETFGTPQSSVESSAAFCLFVNNVSVNLQLDLPVLASLMKLTKFDFFRMYLEKCIEIRAEQQGFDSSISYFQRFRLDLIKKWWTDGLNLSSFPYQVFGYLTTNYFILDNSKYLMAVMCATKSTNVQKASKESFSKTIAEVTSTSALNLTKDCIPTIIAVAYSSNGYRNEVFALLKDLLASHYHEQVLELLSLIIWEVVQFTDVKSESSLKVAVGQVNREGFFESSEILKCFTEVSIDPHSSVELISTLLKSFWAGKSTDFWCLETVYFLVRQLGLEKQAPKLLLRRLQFVLSISKMDVSDFKLIELVIEICLSTIKVGVVKETSSILNLVEFQACLEAPMERLLPMIFSTLATIISADDQLRQLLQGLCESIDNLIEQGRVYFGQTAVVMRSALKIIGHGDAEISINDLEGFFETDDNSFLFSRSASEILVVVSLLLKHIDMASRFSSSKKMAEFFLKHLCDVEIDGDFRLWISEYLAEFYLSGVANESLEDIMLSEEYCGFHKNNIVTACNSLTPFVDYLVRRLEDGTYEEKAFLESVLGTMINMFETKRRDVAKFVAFDTIYDEFKSYITPLDLHSFVLLNSKRLNGLVSHTSLDLLVQDFGGMILRLSFEDWTCEFLLALIHEVLKSSGLETVFASCVRKMPSIARHVIPNFVCFYVFSAGSKAGANIVTLFDEYWKNFKVPYCQETIKLMGDVAICVRIAAMQNIDTFTHLYSALNHEHLFQILGKSHLSKTALLFFEESISGKVESINWAEYLAPLADLYASLNDEDLITGIPGDAAEQSSLSSRHQFATSAEKLRYSSGAFDAEFILNKSPLPKDLITSLLEEGYLGASNGLNQHFETVPLSQWSWKLGQWDLPMDDTSSARHDVTYSFFKKVRGLQINEQSPYKCAMMSLFSGLSNASKSGLSPREAFTFVEDGLQGLALIKSVSTIFSSLRKEFDVEISRFVLKTTWFSGAGVESFEDILWARRLAFSFCGLRISSKPVSSELENLCRQGEMSELVRYNNLLRHNGMLQKTVTSSILLEKIVEKEIINPDLRENLQRVSLFQTAHTLWAEGKMDLSVALLQKLAGQGDISLTIPALHLSKVTVNAQLAVWLADSRLDRGLSILERVVKPMIPDIALVEDSRQRAEVYRLLARFCELQFKSLVLKDQLLQLETRVRAKKEEVQELKSHYGRSEALASERNAARYYYDDLKSLIKAESSELSTLKELRLTFAHNSAKFYLNALLMGEPSEEVLDKFFSLFLELSGDETLQATIKSELSQLSSVKPLAWCSQILSRVSKESSSFQESVQRLIFKVCHDHPFHSLYYLTSLLFHERLARESANTSMLSRVVAASHIRNKLNGSSSSYASKYLLPVEKICTESVSLAEVKSTKGKTLHLDKLKVGTFWLNELPAIPPPTLRIAVSTSGYKNVPIMEAMDPKVSIASSGISLPKVVTFLLSNGEKHKMLLKHGTDDLRQDAIMEQVFDKVNKIFLEDKETRKRKLRVRTYSAVPLGPKAGVIEFVPDSKALFEVIQPYHLAMDSMKLDKARELMKSSQAKDFKERLRVYRSIEEKIKPVLRHYFLRNFVTPDDWFKSRQIYIRGVATSSMVGHILGLGDRHCNNILLDEYTGEPIHIDLGVAFDQGKRLKVPETVPFRLTRDIVDGFGYMGTAGSFTKVSEHTFRVLQASKEHILAILDVLRWDPLYSWSISPIKKRKIQEGSTEVLNLEAKLDGSAAGKAILGVSDKLAAGGLSVEAVVRELIREASSELNLAVIYCGWCPFY